MKVDTILAALSLRKRFRTLIISVAIVDTDIVTLYAMLSRLEAQRKKKQYKCRDFPKHFPYHF